VGPRVSKDLSPSSNRARFPARTNRLVAVGATAWVFSVAFFVVQGIAQVASKVPYDMATNAISDLGNTACGPDLCSPLHLAVNATFVAVGLLHVAGAFLTHSAWPGRRQRDAARSFLIYAGLCLVVAGLVPEDANLGLHRWAALTGLLCVNFAVIFYGLSLATTSRLLAVTTTGSGVLGLAGFLGLMLLLGGVPVGPAGLIERIADYPAVAVIVVLGVCLLLATATATWHAARRSEPPEVV
jgi:hypothetical membrane protein